jgi:hypothetical protein
MDGHCISGGGLDELKDTLRTLRDEGETKAILILDAAYQFAVSIGVYAPTQQPPRCADETVLACIRIWNFGHVGIQDVVDRVQTGATVKARLPKTSRHIKPSDLRAQAEKLIADGMMPNLDKLLDVVTQIRTKYQPKILEARRQAAIHVVRKTV